MISHAALSPISKPINTSYLSQLEGGIFTLGYRSDLQELGQFLPPVESYFVPRDNPMASTRQKINGNNIVTWTWSLT